MSPNAPIRSRWALLTKIAWPAALLLITVGLAVVCFGGHSFTYDHTYCRHGRPFLFLHRNSDTATTWYAIWVGRHYFSWFAFVLDVLVVVGILLALIFGPRWPTRRDAPQRRWNMSLPTFLTVIMGGIFFVVCFGGTRIDWRANHLGLIETWEHGWPLAFLQRDGSMESTRFSFLENQVWEDPDGFQPWLLVVDSLVFLGLLGLLIFIPRWLNRRPAAEGRIAFSLSSLFVVLTIACLLLGNISLSVANSRTERAAMAALRKGHWLEVKYIGPVWVARLLGSTDPYGESILHGCRSIAFSASPDESELQEVAAAIQSLPNLEQVVCGEEAITDAELQRLFPANRSAHIKQVCFYGAKITGTAFRDAKRWPRLTSIQAIHIPLDDKGFANLARISSLTQIEVSETKITKASLAEAAKMPKLKHFTAKRLGFTKEDCAELEKRGVECHVGD